MNWFTKNWRTTLIGLGYIGCNVSAVFVPFMAGICPWIDKVLIAGGFLAAADSAALTTVNDAALTAVNAIRSRTGQALFVLLTLGLASPALAQTIVLDFNKAELAWDWTKGTAPNLNTGDVERFDVLCGRQSGVYSSTSPVNDPLARSVKIGQLLNGQGVWFCVVSAANRYGSSGHSNEVSFDVGAAPASPANVRVQAQ